MGGVKAIKKKHKENISVIRLDSCHKDQLVDLIQKRHDKMLAMDSDMLNFYLNPDSKFPVLFGVFQKQKLLSTLGLWKWEALPYATITCLLTQPGSIVFHSFANGFSFCFDEVIRYGHKNGVLAYYSFRKLRKQKKTNSVYKVTPEHLKKYFAYTEAIIPKNTRPIESIYWELMDKEIKPFTGEIRKTMLKPEFLSNLDIHSFS